MRLLETTRAAVAVIQELTPPPASTTRPPPCDPSSGDWAYAAMEFVIGLGVYICAFALVRCFTRRGPSSSSSGSSHVQERKPSSAMVYPSSSGMMMKLNECPICLSDFVEGEGVRVLERCNHGFHARCIDTWLSGHSSCPTCFALAPHNSSTSAAGEREGVVERDDDRESGGVDVDGGPPTTEM